MYDAVVVECHHSLRVWWQNENESLKKYIFFIYFLGRLPLLPVSHLVQNFGPYGSYFALVTPSLLPGAQLEKKTLLKRAFLKGKNLLWLGANSFL